MAWESKSTTEYGGESCEDEGRKIVVGADVFLDGPEVSLFCLERTFRVCWTETGAQGGGIYLRLCLNWLLLLGGWG